MNPFWSVSLFWIAAVVCVAVALVFILPPLLRKKEIVAKAARRDINIAVYRDQMKEMEADRSNGLLSEDQFQTAKVELEARLVEDALIDPHQATTEGNEFVGFWLRLAAYFVDSLVLLPIGVIWALLIPFSIYLAIIGSFFAAWLYFALMESSTKQATIGKQIVGARIVNEDGNRISFGTATKRFLSKALLSTPFAIGYLWIAISKKKQAFHDVLADTYVKPAEANTRMVGVLVSICLPVAAFGMYFWLGNPSSLIAIAEAQANPPIAAEAVKGEHDIMKMIQKVEEKTKTDPNDGEAWTMLGKTYAAVGHWPEALHAYEKALKLKPDVPAVMTGYAEALAISRNRVLKGEPIQLVLKALEKDPNDMKGLELAAISNFQDKNYAQAAYYFKHLLKLLPPESPYAQDIAEAQKEATRLSRGTTTGLDNLADQAPAGKDKAASPGATLHGKVDIAPALKGKFSDKDVIFLFARSAEGGAPVAAIRATAGKFPLEFELSDAMAMNPDNKLSNFKEVTLTVRISKSGDPKGGPGDLEGTLTGVKVGARDIKLTIDKVKP